MSDPQTFLLGSDACAVTVCAIAGWGGTIRIALKLRHVEITNRRVEFFIGCKSQMRSIAIASTPQATTTLTIEAIVSVL